MRELPHDSSHLLVRFCGCSIVVAGHSASLPPPASLHYVLSVDTCSASKPASRCHAGAEETKCSISKDCGTLPTRRCGFTLTCPQLPVKDSEP